MSSTAVSEQNISTPAPCRGGLHGGLHGFPPVQGSAVDFPVPLGDADEGFFRTFPHGEKCVSADLPRHVSSWTPAAYVQFRGFHEEQLAKEKEEDEGDVSAAGADALPPRHLGTVFRVHVAEGVIKGDDGRMFTFRSSSMEGSLPMA